MRENGLIQEDLYAENERLKAIIEELESRHHNECAQIAQYSDENAKLKVMLRKAVEDLNNSIGAMYTCPYCKYVDKSEVCAIRKEQYCGDLCKWRYADEALALIGRDGEQNDTL